MAAISVRQVSLNAGNLETTLAFWADTLGLEATATFDPPGFGFIVVGGVRLIFQPDVAPGTIYLDVTNLDATYAQLAARDIVFFGPPTKVFEDKIGQFGPAGETEWMAFFKDPARNTIGLVERR